MNTSQDDTQPTERSPLLQHKQSSKHSIQTDNGNDYATTSRSSEEEEGPISEQNDETARSDSSSASTEPLTTKQLLVVMSGPYIASFLAALDSTLVATLTSPISSTFSSATLFSWLASSYFIANAVSQPLAGKLTDIYGRKNGMILSILLFGAGNLVCGFAQSKEVVVLGRVVAGLGGGGIGPIATVLVNDLVPLRSRVLWRGVINVAFGVGSGIGGPFAGLINDRMGWRWAFFLQTPPTLLAILLVVCFQQSPSRRDISKALQDKARYLRIDVVGAVLLVTSVAIMLLGLNAAGNVVPWDHPLVLTTLPLSVVLLTGFAYYEANVATEPIIPTQLLLHRTMFSACAANWLITAARFGVLFYAPVFFYAQGYSSSATGLRLVPESVAIGVSSITCGILIRKYARYRFVGNCIGILFVLGMAIPVSFSKSTGIWTPIVSFILIGIGYSGVMSVTLIAMIAAVDDQFQAVITSASYVFRSTGSMIGITIASTVFQNLLRIQLGKKLGDAHDVEAIVRRTWNNFDAIRHLTHELSPLVIQCYFEALRGVFGVLLGLATLGSIIMAFMREHALDRK